MATRDIYNEQVQLLVRVLPHLAAEKVFALKGGTAINLFVRDLPRLSVDIDLTYLPIEDYEASVAGIDAALERMAARIVEKIVGTQINAQRSAAGHIERVHVQSGRVGIKIEVTPVLRGVVYDPAVIPVSAKVEEIYGYADAQVVSLADLYAGKLVAALDRQHPRDLYDVRLLLAEDGISDDLRRAFIAYALQSRKPLNVILAPPRRDLALKYAQEFEGMTVEPVSLQDLEATREAMIETVVGGMPDEHRRFLVTFKRGEPDWDLLGLPKVADLPAVKFRQEKLDALPANVRSAQLEKLEQVLFGREEGA
jgi:predicted nucleotidyltransferase component of viral defense system